MQAFNAFILQVPESLVRGLIDLSVRVRISSSLAASGAQPLSLGYTVW